MKRFFAFILFVMILSGSAFAADEAITVANTAIGFTTALISPTSGAHAETATCTLETAQIRFRTSGSDPTTTVGHVLEAGQLVKITGRGAIDRFRAIRTTSTSGALYCTYD